MTDNIILLTDSYKTSHNKQYPPGTQYIYSYFESRGGEFHEWTQFFGLQYFLKKYLVGQVVTKEKIVEAAELLEGHGVPFNREGWEYILKEHDGHLPVTIKAVPEGTRVPNKNVLMTIENTDPNCFWLTNYLETLLVQVWYPSTVATVSRGVKDVVGMYMEKTCDTVDGLPFKLHDFGFRGVSSVESACIGGLAHLVNFLGTDTLPALTTARDYYGATDVAGFSIPASEHSTMTSWGRDNEYEAYKNMLEQYPEGLVACVSDSYDIYNACENIWGDELKKKILKREGTLVIRPDSGHPIDTIMECLRILGKQFGTTTNSKGYRVLPDQVRIIQGDGIDPKMLYRILKTMQSAQWSADNIAFGMGGGLLQRVNRDTQKFAFKCSSAVIGSETVDVYKDPVGSSFKKSKRGRVALFVKDGEYVTAIEGAAMEPAMVEVFRDGELLVDWTLDAVRNRANDMSPVSR